MNLNTYTAKLALSPPIIRSNRVFINNWAVRVKYIGPLLNRGGVGTTIHSASSDQIEDTAKASYHPHCYVAPIEDKWFYLRYKPKPGDMSMGEAEGIAPAENNYFYFEGLPVSSACLLVEAVVV